MISIGVSLPDLLAKLFVEEGQEVKEGEALAELASRSDRQLELDLLEYQIKEAELKLKDIERTGALQLALDELQIKQIKDQGPYDIKMQKSKVQFLKKQTDQALNNFGLNRISPLPSVSKQEKDQQEMVLRQSQAELAAAEDLLQKLTLGQDLNLQLAQAKLSLAKANLDRTRQEVPMASR